MRLTFKSNKIIKCDACVRFPCIIIIRRDFSYVISGIFCNKSR